MAGRRHDIDPKTRDAAGAVEAGDRQKLGGDRGLDVSGHALDVGLVFQSATDPDLVMIQVARVAGGEAESSLPSS